MRNWTEEQYKAINEKGKNLLISAAAGSGKTAVLSERVKRLIIEDKVDIDKFLIVTFTSAAASEMRERIVESLLELAGKNDGIDSHINKQIGLINKASIMTLHSFCLNTLRKYSYKIDLDIKFRVGETIETDILLEESLSETIEEEFKKVVEEENDDFEKTVSYFSKGYKSDNLEKIIMSLYRFLKSQPDPKKWIKEKAGYYLEKEDGIYFSKLKGMTIEKFEEMEETIESSLREIEGIEDFKGYTEALLSDLEQIKRTKEIVKNRNYSDTKDALANIKFSKFKKAPKELDDETKEKIKKKRDSVKKILKEKLIEKYYVKEIEVIYKENKEIFNILDYLGNLVFKVEESYLKKKKEKSIVDFNDLEHFTLLLLEDEEIASEIKSKYEYIIVDEYQDSNIVQESILKKISRENNRFLVGDIKQSIYRFRLADPTLFIKKYNEYTEDPKNSEKIDLSRNFRSRGEILEFINVIFEKTMTYKFGEIEYDENARLYTGSAYENIEEPVEVNIIDTSEQEFLKKEINDMEKAELEALLVTNKIKSLIGKDTFDIKLGKHKKAKYRDIVILLRSMKGTSDIYEEVLTRNKIPVYTDSSGGYFDALEVKVFLNLLKIIDNRMQDIPLLSVLRSAIGNFSISEIIKIREIDLEKNFCDNFLNYKDIDDKNLLKKIKELNHKLDKWKEYSQNYRLEDFIWKVLIESNYYYYVETLPNGKQRRANLEMLMDKSASMEKAHIRGLFNFIRYFDKIKNVNKDMGTAKSMGENEDVVRIMSVHKSKGLEFPIVIYSGLGKQFNLMDTKEGFVRHKDLGLGTKYINLEDRIQSNTISENLIKEQIKIETLSEELRILYVGLSRAKDKLIISGAVSGIDKSIENWRTGQKYYNYLKDKTPLDWIMRSFNDKLNLENIVLKKEVKYLDYKINLVDREELSIENNEIFKDDHKLKLYLEKEMVEKGEKEKIEKIFSWKYRYEKQVKMPSKVSATYIKELKNNDKDLSIKIDRELRETFEKENKSTGKEIGVLNHKVLEVVEFKDKVSNKDIEVEIGRLKNTKEEKDHIDREAIIYFFKSDMYKRILKSEKVFKEKEFIYYDFEEGYYIQGVVDCYFIEGNRIILIDYKSDKSSKQDYFKNKYLNQINIYSKALEDITEKKVCERYIYSLFLKEFILI